MTLDVVSWPMLLLALVVFGFAPGLVLRLIVLAFPRDDPRREELLGELHAVPRFERPFWVADQLEVALFEGVHGRFAARRAKREPTAPLAYRATPHLTIRGELLRSKSEVVIANCLHSIGLHYEYERHLEGTADPGYLRPDFTNIGRTGNVVLWEHLGMLDHPPYAAHWYRKLAWYARNGFELDKNLFVTSQTGSLDMLVVEATAKKVQKALGYGPDPL